MRKKPKDESKNVGLSRTGGTDTAALPAVVDRATFQAELDVLRVRENAHTCEGDDRSRPPTAPHGRGGRCHTAHWRTRGGDTVGCV